MNLKKRIAAILALLGTSTLVIHLINRYITLTSTLDNNLNSNQGLFYEWRFGKIYYNVQGSGSPILLIHDIKNYSSSYEWSGIISSLSKTNTVYTIDLLGCGRSDKPNLTYTNFIYVQLVCDFIKDIIGTKADIIASSSALSIVLMSNLYNSELIDRILAVNPFNIELVSKAPTNRSKLLKSIINLPIIGTLIYNLDNTKKSIHERFIFEFFNNTDNIKKSDVDNFYESCHIGGCSSKYLYASLKGNYLSINLLHALSSINNSIYMIVSDASPNYLTVAEQYLKQTPSIEIVTSKDTELYPHLENPIEFIDKVNILFDL